MIQLINIFIIFVYKLNGDNPYILEPLSAALGYQIKP